MKEQINSMPGKIKGAFAVALASRITAIHTRRALSWSANLSANIIKIWPLLVATTLASPVPPSLLCMAVPLIF